MYDNYKFDVSTKLNITVINRQPQSSRSTVDYFDIISVSKSLKTEELELRHTRMGTSCQGKPNGLMIYVSRAKVVMNRR